MIKLSHEISDPREKAFIKTVMEYTYKADIQNKAFFTSFYNKEWMEQTIQKHIRLNNLSNYKFFGGYEYAERQILGFFPYYDTERVFPIAYLKINVKTGIGKPLSHRDFLGALLGLGLQRDTIGDIILKPFGAFLIIESHMTDYIRGVLTGIGKYHSIDINEISLLELEIEAPKTKEIYTTVASLRADVIAAAGFGISRTTSAKFIQNEKARCNGIEVSSSCLLKEGDIITLRGYGKIKLKQVNGLTKKDRLHICIEKYI